uniref:Uncharacterized protein n=1 Tax=Plectus sambesii TaxID=2011161 RepID=A0A914WKB9_9BILA
MMLLLTTIWFTFCAFNCATAQQPPYPAYGFPNGQPPYNPCNSPQPCPNQQNCGGCANGVNPLENYNGGSNLCGATICQPGQFCIAGRCVATPGNTIGLNVNPFQQNQVCQFNTDCPAGFACQGGQCAPAPPGGLLGGLGGGPINGQQACSEVQPCFAGQVCVGGVCVASGTANIGNIGYVETTTCLSNDFCKVNERCQSGYCVGNQLIPPFGNPNGIFYVC